MIGDLAVAALVLSLPLSLRGAPFAAATTSGPEGAPVADVLASYSSVDAPRARAVARGEKISTAGDPRTAIAPEQKPIVRIRLTAADSLQSIANHFKISAEAIAFSNGISDPDLRPHLGREIMIPPGEGALYTVKSGDTVEGVAARFAVDPRAIMDHNRLYFEPENFGPERIVFVPGATVPGLVYAKARPGEQVRAPSVLSRPVAAATASAGTLLWPVIGESRVTQYFWGFHSGVDIAANYGSEIRTADAGTVVYAGWVPVGGLSVRVLHANGLESGYYHTGALFVTTGQQVARGQVIASVGMTGVTTGPHLHWELTRNGAFLNPMAHTSR